MDIFSTRPCRAFTYRPGMTRAIGGTGSRGGTDAYTLWQDGIFRLAGVDVIREADHLWDNGRFPTQRTLLEPACTNSALGSSDFSITTYWSASAGYTLAAATSCISGQAATKHTNTSVANVLRAQNIGTFVNGQVDVLYAIVEGGTAPTTRVEIFDATAAANAGTATYTWATDSIATSGSPTGSGRVVLAATGPNGGKLVLIWVSFTGTAAGTGAAGNTRQAQIFVTGTAADTTFGYLHHGQFQAATDVPMSPIVTVAAGVTRAADALDFPFTPTAATLATTGISIYESYIITEKDLAVTGELRIGSDSGGGGAQLRAYRDGSAPGFYCASFDGASNSSISGVVNPTVAIGDRIERLSTFTAGGAATITVSVNGGAATTSATGAAGGWTTFAAQRLYMVNEWTAARKGGLSRDFVGILPYAVNGQAGLDRMRRLQVSNMMGDGSLQTGGWGE